MIKFTITGFDPVAETMEAASHYGCYIGQPIVCKGLDGRTWEWVYTGDSVRKPNELESYLFKSA